MDIKDFDSIIIEGLNELHEHERKLLSNAVNRKELIVSLDCVIKSLTASNGIFKLTVDSETPKTIIYSGNPLPKLGIGDKIKAYFFKGELNEYFCNFDTSELDKPGMDYVKYKVDTIGGTRNGWITGEAPTVTGIHCYLFTPRNLGKEEHAIKLELQNGKEIYTDSELISKFYLQKFI